MTKWGCAKVFFAVWSCVFVLYGIFVEAFMVNAPYHSPNEHRLTALFLISILFIPTSGYVLLELFLELTTKIRRV